MSFTASPRFILAATVLFSLSGLVPAQSPDASPADALKLAGLYLKLGQDTECREALDKLLKASPNNTEGLMLLARLELKQSHAAAALKAASAVLAQEPDDAEAAILKARALAAQGQRDEARKVLSRVPQADLDKHEDELDGIMAAAPSDAQGQPAGKSADDVLDEKLEAVRQALKAHDLAQADKLSAAALRANEASMDALLLRAEYLSQAGKPAEAVTLLRSSKAKSKGLFAGELALAYALQDAGQADEAKQSFERVSAGAGYSAEDRAEAKQALANIAAQAKLDAGDEALDAGRASEALRVADEQLKTNPNNADAKALRARALTSLGRAHEAVEILTALKTTTPKGQRFDGQLDYATALAADGRYHEAESEYRELISKQDQFNADERKDAQGQLDELRDKHFAGGELSVLGGKLEEGTLWRTHAELSTTRSGSNRWSVRSEWDHVELKDDMFPRTMSEDRTSTDVQLDTAWTPLWSTSVNVGGFESGVIAGAGVTYARPGGVSTTLQLDYNAPARMDTLLLDAMDGRQHAISAIVSVPLSRQLVIESTVLGRRIEVDGTNIGHAVGTETQVRWHPLGVDHDLYLAYMLELKDFSGREEAFEREAKEFFGTSGYVPAVTDAVPDRINRHALQAHGSTEVTERLKASALAEVAWRQETEQVEWGAVGELLWRVSDRASLSARIEYYSGGAGPNAGEGVLLGTIGSKWTW